MQTRWQMALPEAPAGFHYRMQAATLTAEGKTTKLARFIEGEAKMTQKEKYIDMYVVLKDDNGDPTATLKCVCRQDIKCAFYKTGKKDLDFSNFMRHMKSTHPYELTPNDQSKKEDPAATAQEALGLKNPLSWVGQANGTFRHRRHCL